MRRTRAYISTLFSYACNECGVYLTAADLLKHLRYDDEVFTQIPEFSSYYLSRSGRVLSLRTNLPRLLKVQRCGNNAQVVRMKPDAGICATRTLRSLVRTVYGEALSLEFRVVKGSTLRSQSDKGKEMGTNGILKDICDKCGNTLCVCRTCMGIPSNVQWVPCGGVCHYDSAATSCGGYEEGKCES